MELKVGMYVRFGRNQGIRKIIDCIESECYVNGCYVLDMSINDEWGESIDVIQSDCEDILDSSFNIIDLIHKGDYVNGKKVITIYEKGDSYIGNGNYVFTKKTVEVDNDNYETIPINCLFANYDIEDVVTKEEFDNRKYHVG